MASIKDTLDDFIEMQRAYLLDLAQKTDVGIDELRETIGQPGQQRWDRLKTALSKLSELDETPKRKIAS